MTAAIIPVYDRAISVIAGRLPESVMLLFVRIAFAGIFWRSGRSKLVEGSWFTISDTSYELFRTEYAGAPLPPDLATVAAAGAEHLFPILLVLGLFTRASAFALLIMIMVIQIFVYPDAWWPVHSLWAALALVLIVRGGGLFSLDTPLALRVRR